MLVTMQNAELIRKLMELAGGDIDLVQAAIRVNARPGNARPGNARPGNVGADLQKVVNYIVGQRRAAAASVRQAAHAE